MMRMAKFMLLGMLLSVSASYAAQPGISATAVAEMMKQARYSDGFEARMNVLITKANGAHPAPFKLAVIGQFSPGKQRLALRGISPETVRNHFYAAEAGSDGHVRAVSSHSKVASDYVESDPNAMMFNSGLVVWDMFGLWWNWPRQLVDGVEQINGRECVKIRSFTDDKNSVVREVESCVDQGAKLSLRTRMFDGGHTLLRTTAVAHLAHKGEGGTMMAKNLKIVADSNMLTDIEIYAGDEQYQISAETFAMLDRLTPSGQQDAR